MSVSSTAGSHAVPGRWLYRRSDKCEGPADRLPRPHALCTTASSVLRRADGSTVWPRRSACTASETASLQHPSAVDRRTHDRWGAAVRRCDTTSPCIRLCGHRVDAPVKPRSWTRAVREASAWTLALPARSHRLPSGGAGGGHQDITSRRIRAGTGLELERQHAADPRGPVTARRSRCRLAAGWPAVRRRPD